jgi:hypothetical protein
MRMTWPFQPLLPGAAQQQAASASYTLAAGAGSFGLSGQAVAPRLARQLGALPAAFVLTGQTVNLRHAFTLAAGAGSAVLAGQVAGISRALQLTAAQGAIMLIGQDLNAAVSNAIASDQGSLTLNGQTAALRIARRLGADRGAFAITGVAVQPSGAAEPVAASPLVLGLTIGL